MKIRAENPWESKAQHCFDVILAVGTKGGVVVAPPLSAFFSKKPFKNKRALRKRKPNRQDIVS